IPDATAAIKLEPYNFNAYLNRGLAHELLGMYDEALVDFTKLTQLNSKHYKGFWWRGAVYKKLGETAKAEADRLEAVKLNPSLANQSLPVCAAPTPRDKQRAKDLAEMGDKCLDPPAKPADAIKLANQALALDSKCIPALLVRAEAFLVQGKDDEAIKD